MALLKKSSTTNNNLNNYNLDIRRYLEKHKDKIAVEITSLTVGKVIFENPINKELYIWLDNESKTVEIDVLFSIFSSNKKLLQNLCLAITNVYVRDDLDRVITPKEISLALGLDKIYKAFDYDLSNIDSYIIDSDIDCFKDLTSKFSKEINCLIAERYNYLNKEGYISDSYKEKALENALSQNDLFYKF